MLETSELASLVGINLAIITAVGGVIWKMSSEFKNLSDTLDAKRARIYERIDEVKAGNKAEFTNKEVCAVLHRQIDGKLTEIAADVKILIKNGHDK